MIVLSSFLNYVQIIITNPDMLHTGVLPNHKVSTTAEKLLLSIIQHFICNGSLFSLMHIVSSEKLMSDVLGALDLF
jgi:hypothetical protein